MSRLLELSRKIRLKIKNMIVQAAPSYFVRPVKDKVGRWGEAEARKQISLSGLVPVATNWRCKDGELDLIALDGRVLVVIEVKTRHISQRGNYPALAAVDYDKRDRLERLGRSFIRNNGPFCRRNAVRARRTDVIEVYYSRLRGWRRVFAGLKPVRVDWHRGFG
jgi:putative endonuclease